MKALHPDDSRITERAAEWLVVLDEGGLREQEAFAAWLGESARHIEEFLFVSTVCKEFSAHFPGKRANVERILAAAQSNIIVLQEDSGQQSRAPVAVSQARKHPKYWAVAAAIASVAMTSWGIATYPQWYGYSTAIGEQRAFELEDGSVIHLNTHSRVKVDITETQREIRLLAGEALFRVARDVQRPFRVHVGDSTVQAVGTQFNIYRRSQSIAVSVIEGSVRITRSESARLPDAGVRTGASSVPVPGAVSMSSGKESGQDGPLLFAGEGASITADGEITRQQNVDAAKVSAWQQRRLVFVDDRLADVAAEFNRYNQTPQIQVTEATGKTLLSGVFDADDPESLLSFIQGLEDVAIERTAQKVIIRNR